MEIVDVFHFFVIYLWKGCLKSIVKQLVNDQICTQMQADIAILM